jgi:predicted GNAT family N-acyltransferase
MVWDAREAACWVAYEYARAFHETHGHLRVPSRYRTEDDYLLGRVIIRQRAECRDERRRAALEAIGMVWDAREAAWWVAYEYSRAFYKTHGHLRVPRGYRTKDKYPLVHSQSPRKGGT